MRRVDAANAAAPQIRCITKGVRTNHRTTVGVRSNLAETILQVGFSP